MRGLFTQLNLQGIKVDKSTFSKASKIRSPEGFEKLFNQLNLDLKKKNKFEKLSLFPLDSTIVSLTSKLFWQAGIHQFKLFSSLNSLTSEIGGVQLHFVQVHDSKYGQKTNEAIPDKSVGVMDRGFSSIERITELSSQETRYFVLKIKNNLTLEMLETGFCRVGKNPSVIVRVVAFCDLDKKSEFRLATNLPLLEESAVTNAEIAEIYCQRWQIELLWKFLKMHLKLDRIITKNVNGITIQVYACLIAYLLLQLLEISDVFGQKLLDKLRYLQAFMNVEKSFVHWFSRLAFSVDI